MYKVHTYSDVKTFIETNSECKLLTSESDYKNSHQKLDLICKCGNHFKTSFQEFKGDSHGNNTRQCKKCINRQRRRSNLLPYSEVVARINAKNCKLLTTESEWINYGNACYKLSIQCLCGNVFKTSLSEFTREKNPKTCCNECTQKRLTSERQDKIFDTVKKYITSNGEELLSDKIDYINSSSKLKIRCKNGHIREQSWEKYFHRDQRCPVCNKRVPYTYEDVKSYLDKLGLTLLTPKESYTNCKMKLSIRCSNGHIFNQTFDAIKNANCTCPQCSMSFGEQKLLNILTRKGISFDRQYTFADCLSDKHMPLRFDFAIMSNGQVESLIEVNGQQHYHSIELWGGEEKLQTQQRNDEIKVNYCKNNNIPLLIIPYWEIDNMENIIDAWCN